MVSEQDQEAVNYLTEVIIATIALLILIGLFGSYLDRVSEFLSNITAWFQSDSWDRFLKIMKVVFYIVDVALLGFIVFTFRQYEKMEQTKKPVKDDSLQLIIPKEEVRASWTEIRRLANSQNPSDWNMAVLRADALLDGVLQDMKYEGATMADRMKIVDPIAMPSLEKIWSAHRLRNSIAHDPLEQNSRETIINALRSYEQALKELKMLEEVTVDQPQESTPMSNSTTPKSA